MLILTRNVGQTIVINENIEVTVLAVSAGKQIKFGIKAPIEISVHREEIQQKILEERSKIGE